MILEQLFLITAVVGAVLALLNIIGANIYDAREINKRRDFRRHLGARRYRRRPLISVLISTHNEETTIEQCLDSLLTSSYRKLEIIVVDAASQDQTRQLVRKYIAAHPKPSIRLVARRSPVNSRPDMHAAYKKYGHGELVMLCDANSLTDKQALTNAVRHFNAEPKLGSLGFNHRIQAAFNTAGLFQKYEHLLRYRSEKFNSVSNSAYAFAQQTGTLCRRELFVPTPKSVGQFGNKNSRAYYASDAVIYTKPVSSLFGLIKQRYRLQQSRLQALRNLRQLAFRRRRDYPKSLIWFRLPFAAIVGLTALFLPLLLTYFIYVAVRLHEPTLFLLSWVTLAVLLLLAVWGDEHLRWRQKLGYTILVPITYVVFYLLSFVQVFVVLRAAISRKNFGKSM
jgi:cellulose synthase/poly-beta-1,6-N-acetylglucosamine synthase-like glycosyltransferase